MIMHTENSFLTDWVNYKYINQNYYGNKLNVVSSAQ